MDDVADPLLAPQFDARELGRHFAARRRWIGLALVLAGLALLVGGIAGFDVYNSRASALQKNGVHTTATVTAAVLHGDLYSSNFFTEHIDVAFPTPSGVVKGVRIPIGDNDRFSLGERVAISYDPSDPRHAVFAHGYADPGAIGFGLFASIVVGMIVFVYAVMTLRLAHRARRALEETPRTMTVESRWGARGFLRRTALILGSDDERCGLWATAGSRWSLPRRAEATVFGTGTRGSVAVVVDTQRGLVTAGRIWRRRPS